MIKFAILGNTNNPINKKPNQPYSWFVKTFRQGLQLNGYEPLLIDYKTNTLQKIKNIIIQNKIDFVFTHLTFHNFHPTEQVLNMFNDINKQIGTKFIHTCHDARNEDRYMKNINGAIFLGIVGTKSMQKNCSKVWNVPVLYMPYSCLSYDTIGEYNPNLDFHKPVFTGSPTAHKDRSDFINSLKKIMSIEIFQTQSKNDLREQTLNLSASSVILGLCTGYDIDGFIDVRPFQYLGTGACMIMRKFKDMNEIIPDELYYSFNTYNDPYIVKEYWEKIQKTDIKPLQRKAFDYMQRYHSSQKRIRQILKEL